MLRNIQNVQKIASDYLAIFFSIERVNTKKGTRDLISCDRDAISIDPVLPLIGSIDTCRLFDGTVTGLPIPEKKGGRS